MNPRSEWRTRQLKAIVLKRDGNVCFCGGVIPLELRWPHPLSFSLDHVTPLAEGGAPFDPANARPSHLHCNTSRGATQGNRARRRPSRTELTW